MLPTALEYHLFFTLPLLLFSVYFPSLLWLGAAFYLAMLGLVAEVALSSERESAREIPTAWEVR